MKILPGLTLNKHKTEDGQETFTLDHRLLTSVRDKKKTSVDERRLNGRSRPEDT
jgi:hypothetical protein